jgi:anti-sigma B factor antagonist
MNLNIDVQYNESESLWDVKLIGDLDINSSIELKDRLTETLDDKEDDIVIDASELSYIDSTGLGVLISLLKRLNNNEKMLLIKEPQDNILKIFKITGLYKVIKIEKEGELIE